MAVFFPTALWSWVCGWAYEDLEGIWSSREGKRNQVGRPAFTGPESRTLRTVIVHHNGPARIDAKE